MPRVADEALTKVTLNLYTKDVEWYKRWFSEGYTEAIRLAVRREVNRLKGTGGWLDGE